MKTELESLWVFALISKCPSSFPILPCLLLLSLTFLTLSFLFWSFPGGPAWGKHHFTTVTTKRKTEHPCSTTPIPGPRGFPFLGSLNLFSKLPHHRLAATANLFRAKRLMAFSLGDTRVVVTGCPEVAKEILQSSVFADRPVKESAYNLMFNRAIGFAPYGVYWRTLRRIASTHLFSPKQISFSESQRSRIAVQMVSVFGENRGGEVRIREVLKRASLNHMMCSVFGTSYELCELNSEFQELSELVEEGYDLLGKLNWSDHLHWLAGLDLQKIRFRCSKLVPKVNRFVARVVDQHRGRTGMKNPAFVDVLLSLQGPDKLSDQDMIAVLWEMIFRGTDTIAVLIEWVLARMVLHVDVQSKVQEELDRVVGKSRAVTESDLSSMAYLTAMVKEVLRLHPPGPLLSWSRLAVTDAMIDGHCVPAGTTAMVNMWAIARDPLVWPDPLDFKPERFINKEGEAEFSIFGSDLRLAPFGSGRRICPGKALGFVTVSFWVATLLHEYEWEAPDQNPVDLSEVLRLSCEMVNPLYVKVRRDRRRGK